MENVRLKEILEPSEAFEICMKFSRRQKQKTCRQCGHVFVYVTSPRCPECNRMAAKRYRIKHPEIVRERNEKQRIKTRKLHNFLAFVKVEKTVKSLIKKYERRNNKTS